MAAVRTWLLVTAVALGLAACKRPTAEACEQAIRNWFTLIYWEDAEKAIAAAPPAQREELRKTKLAERDKQIEDGIHLSVMQCRAARDFDGVKCMKEAATATAARKCRAVKKPD